MINSLILLAALTAPADASGVVTFDGSELARLAGQSGSRLTLTPTETAKLELGAPRAFSQVGFWWTGQLGVAQVALEYGNGELGPWYPLVEDHDLSPEIVGVDRPAGARNVSGLTVNYGTPGSVIHLRLTGPADLRNLCMVWIGPFETAVLPDPLPGKTKSADAAYPKPAVYSRSFWGASAPTCTYTYCNTTHVGIHHSASSSHFNSTSLTQCAQNVKGIQIYHMVTNGWCDIGYNYLVCKHGDLFEGRGGGDNVKAAHDGFNCGSMGVCAMGYFHTPYNQVPTAAMLDSLEELSAWKCSQQGIDPKGSSYYAGYGGTMNNLYGHRDVKSTACPGDQLYALLPQIRNAVTSLLSGGPSSGTLKGILYDASVGTTKRIAGGTVALADGTFVVTDSLGYYEFPLPAGTHEFVATAVGFTAKSSQETITSGDAWESLGLQPAAIPAHTVTPLGPALFQATFEGDPGGPVRMVYSSIPSIPPYVAGSFGLLWPTRKPIVVLPLGTVPASGVLTTNLQTPTTPGLVFLTQALVKKGGQWTLTNGAGFLVK